MYTNTTVSDNIIIHNLYKKEIKNMTYFILQQLQQKSAKKITAIY